jgi:hypothetical protein
MVRKAWPEVINELKTRRKMQVQAAVQLATVGSFDGETLELVFPPGRDFHARKTEEKSRELVEVLRDLLGVTPQLRMTIRQGTAIEPEADEPPATPEAAEELLKEQFGAEVVEIPEAEERD